MIIMKDVKLVNYKRGYNNKFDCTIHGTIYMTYGEWKKALTYLRRAIRSSFIKEMLNDDIKRTIETNKGFLVNIRITATEMLASHLKLNKYRLGNYQIYVTNDF